MKPLALLILFAAVNCAFSAQYLSAVLEADRQKIQLIPGKQQGAVAWASFDDAINREGWSYLDIRTNPVFDDEIAAYAAGTLEGNLTRNMMENHYMNIYKNYCDENEEYCSKLSEYFSKQLDWLNVRSQADRYRSPFWNQVFLMLKQLKGIEDAYNNDTLKATNLYQNVTWLYFTNNEGALYDLETYFNRTKNNATIFTTSPCSMLVKTTPKSLLVGHTTWINYRFMLRLQKRYSFPFKFTLNSPSKVPGHTISMSSYPGKVSSMDDFYAVSTGLVVTETTNDVYDKSLYAFIKPESVPTEWRAMVANRIARDGRHWTRQFEKHNSGTYNNQWVVIDYNKITNTATGVAIGNETFWMLEQLPTLIVSKDMTEVLRSQGFWSSYNVPYFPAIYNESGYLELYEKFGDHYSHENCARAKIFQRDQFRVEDNASMIKMLRYNDYKNDPLSRCNCTPPYSPVYAISSRYDLLEPTGVYDNDDLSMRPDGAIDVKVADSRSIIDFSFDAVSGPTSDQQPVFSWSKSQFSSMAPLGHPDTFAFKPVRHKWNL